MVSAEIVARAQLRVHATLAGKYRLDHLLGVGGMGAVYAATHVRNAKRVAVKVLHAELLASSNLRARFQREGYAANLVGHPGAVQIDDDDEAEDGTPFIVMELLDGIAVEDLRRRHGGRVDVRLAVPIIEELLQVLRSAHEKGVVHRDIKPSNLFLRQDGSVKVLDFGIARVRDGASFGGVAEVTATDELLGTPGFMAPEQALGRAEEVDPQTDLWAVSATLFILLGGECVYSARNQQEMRVCAARDPPRPLRAVAPHVPEAVARVVDRGLARVKSERWPTADAMREALLAVYRADVGEEPAAVTADKWAPELPDRIAEDRGDSCAATVSVAPNAGDGDAPRASERRPPELRPASSSTGRRRGSLGRATWLIVAAGISATGVAGWRARRASTSAPFAGSSAALSLGGPSEGTFMPPEVDGEADVVSIERREASEVLAAPAPVDAPRGANIPGKPSVPPRAPVGGRSCNPPTTVDSAGIKHPKPWCL